MFVARRPVYSERQLREAIAESLCWSDVLRRLGRRTAGGNHRTVQRYAALWKIRTDHFDKDIGRKRAGHFRTVPLEEVLVERSSFSRGRLKKRLYAEGLKQPRCELCGQDEHWHGRRMSLILDHINGVHDDHRLENLQVVCPDCAATLDTHCNRNAVLRTPRTCLECEQDFIPKYAQHRYCSITCSGRSPLRSRAGVPRPSSRKVERPPYAQLLRELEESNWSAVGRKYGVSDNAVRKWVRSYERSR